MKLFGRRAAMQLGAGAVAAAPAIARGAVEVASGKQNLDRLAGSVGWATEASTPPRPHDPIREAFLKPLRESLRLAERNVQDRHMLQVNGLDPDIESLKSLPMHYRVRMQRERNMATFSVIEKLRKKIWGD